MTKLLATEAEELFLYVNASKARSVSKRSNCCISIGLEVSLPAMSCGSSGSSSNTEGSCQSSAISSSSSLCSNDEVLSCS